MNIRYILAGTVVLLGFSGTSSGCSSARSTCALICDCEHCGDLNEDLTCAEYEVQEAAANAYECNDKWEDYMTCVQDKGTCDEKRARFSTRANGTCSDTETLGLTCMTNADCQVGIPGAAVCSAGACVVSRCSNGGDYCTGADDCLGQGDDLCESKEDALAECVAKASGGAPPKAF